MRLLAPFRSPSVCVAIALLAAVGVYAFAEFTGRPYLDPNAWDNRLPERYEEIHIGMPYRQVVAMLGQPNREFVIVGVKIGAVGGGPREEQDAWSGKRVWVDQQHTFTIVISKEEEIVVSKKLFHLFTKKVIAHEP